MECSLETKLETSPDIFRNFSQISIISYLQTLLFLFDPPQHANRYHVDEIEKLWFFDSEQKMFFPDSNNKKKQKQKQSKDRFQCSFCPKIFTTIDPLYQHANRYHLEDIEKQWFFNPIRKMYLPKPPDLNKKQNQGPVIWYEKLIYVSK